MRKLISITAAIAAFAILPATAMAGPAGYGTPGLDNASCNGEYHGAFGAFSGDRNPGDDAGAPGMHDGLVGQQTSETDGATGYNNSQHVCS